MPIKIEANAEPIPGYRLTERLGGGGFGEVWKAVAPGGLFKAIKCVYGQLDSADEDAARAEQELRALERIKIVRHSYILSLERIDKVDGQLFIVMELADRTLWDRFKECRSEGQLGIPRKELIGYMKETAEALDFMYTQFQLLHLDIKPQNLFLVYNHIKVADFGLTKNLKDSAASITGGVTPVYAAPETFDGEGRRSTDQYSLAIVYQEMLTGQRPFAGTTARQLVLQHLQAEPDLTSLPLADQTVVRKALNKDYRDRFASCLDFVLALEEASAEKSQPPPVLLKLDLPQPCPSSGFATPVDDAPAPGSETMPGRQAQADKQPAPGRATSRLFDQVAVQKVEPLPIDGIVPPRTHRSGDRPDSLLPEDLESAANAHDLVPQTQSTVPPPHRPAPARVSDEGVLLPALVIGIGFLGQAVLKQLRQQIADSFGAPSHLANIRTVYLDSDPDHLTLATRGGAAALHTHETVLTRLHRASHYIKPKDGTTSVQSWLPSRMLYRIPRQAVPAGVRALGRLAFVDNYESIVRRLELELHSCMTGECLSTAQEKTGLGVYSTAPRVYVVTSLAGGTGSGMFIDIGYAVRSLLKQAGYENPDVVGVFLLPNAEKKANQSPALANTFAALTELQHFNQPGATYSTAYEGKDGKAGNSTHSAKEPPFRRCLFVPTAGEHTSYSDDIAATGIFSSPTIAHAASIMFTELCTPLGREVDRERQKWMDMQPRQAGGSRERVIYQTANMVRIHWPFKQVMHRASAKLCQRLVKHWMNKDAKPLRESIKLWVQKQWGELELSANQLIERLQEPCQKQLGADPATLIHQILQPLTDVLSAAASPPPGAKPAFEEEDRIIPLARVVDALEQFEQLLGIPEGCNGVGNKSPCTGAPSQVAEILKDSVARVATECEVRIAELVVRLIEQPEFRLAGAEETLRQFSDIVQRALEYQEELTRELQENAAGLYVKIHTLLENPEKKTEKESSWRLSFSRRTSSRKSQYAKELLEVLRAYPKCRYQSLVLQHVNSLYVSLRGQLSDQLREVDFCRARLSELAAKFQEALEHAEKPTCTSHTAGTGICHLLLPEDCQTIENAVDVALARLTVQDFFALDHEIEKLIRKQHRALVHVCMGSSTSLRNLVPQMLWETQSFVQVRQETADAVKLYLDKFLQQTEAGTVERNEPALAQALLAAYDDAEPKLLGSTDEDSLCIVATPESPESEELRRLARQALPRTRVQYAQSVDEIIIYRERLHPTLASLKQLTRTTRPAYEQMTRHKHMSPHSRLDISNWAQLST